MLKLKDLVENYDLARWILNNWDHDEESLNEHLPYFRISSNAVYPFAQRGRLCFLRFAPVAEKDYENLLGEVEFITYLRKNGYPALEPIPAKSGELVLTLSTPWGQYYAAAFYGVEGEPIEESDFSEAVCYAYGKRLGELHRLSQGFAPKMKKQTHLDILERIEERLTTPSPDAALLAVLNELRIQLDQLPLDAAHYGLVHYDFECDNVFYDARTGSCNVIDFDDSIYHFYDLDLEQAIDSIYNEAPEERHESAVEAFIRGYAESCPPNRVIGACRPLMRTFCDLYSYTKLLYCLSEPVENPPAWMVELTEKLTRKAAYLRERLVAHNE